MGQNESKPKQNAGAYTAPTSWELTAEEKLEKIAAVYKKLEDIGVGMIRKAKPETNRWHDEAIRGNPQLVREAITLALNADLPDNGLIRRLWVGADKIYKSPQEARQAILNEVERRHPRAVPAAPKAPESPALAGFSFRVYHRTYDGNAGLAAYIVDRRFNPARSDYLVTLVDRVVAKMAYTVPPAPSKKVVGKEAAERIYQDNGPFVHAVGKAYNEAVQETSGKTDTQLGLKANHISYR
jgi:hypothetical protein